MTLKLHWNKKSKKTFFQKKIKNFSSKSFEKKNPLIGKKSVNGELDLTGTFFFASQKEQSQTVFFDLLVFLSENKKTSSNFFWGEQQKFQQTSQTNDVRTERIFELSFASLVCLRTKQYLKWCENDFKSLKSKCLITIILKKFENERERKEPPTKIFMSHFEKMFLCNTEENLIKIVNLSNHSIFNVKTGNFYIFFYILPDPTKCSNLPKKDYR